MNADNTANELYNPLNGQTTIKKRLFVESKEKAEEEAEERTKKGWKPYMKYGNRIVLSRYTSKAHETLTIAYEEQT